MNMDAAHVFVVEDEDTIALGVVKALEHDGHRVTRFDRAETAIAAYQTAVPDLVLLDIMLPGVDGLEALRRMKAHNADIPIIMLTAKGDEAERVEGLELGADDYVPKPFSLRELLARVRARLRAREGANETPDEFRFGLVQVDLRRRILVRDGGPEQRLTTHEAGVLAYLIAHRGRDVTREELLEKVWGYAPTMQTRTVDNQILKLRKKVEEEPADPRHILTIHGKGYRFEP
ncbi:MAG: response regulator transcription factor [Alphaproteobacteria bacterium]|nr:response regulator transcription factor [Alphaproteobacteria bacterium]